MKNKLSAQTLRGNWGTLLLPINADDSIDFQRLSDEIDAMIAVSIDGIYSNGTAGEFHNQTEAEFDKINELLSTKCHKASMHFQIGASHSSPIISLEKIKRTLHLQPDAYQIILPDWVTATESEQIAFLSKLADEAKGIPLVLYNPPHAKGQLTPNQIKKLSDNLPTLIGVKVAGGDAQWYNDMAWSIDAFSVFVPGHFLATGLQTKVADGAYSNVACINPKAAQTWWELMQNDINEGLAIQQHILDFFAEAIVPYKNAGYSNPALDKLLAAVGGWATVGTRLRWPYRWIPEEEVGNVRKSAEKHLPSFFFTKP